MATSASTPIDQPSSELAASLWARQKAPTEQRVTARVHKLVEDLPSWDPLPPGEIMVRRGGSL